MEDRKGMPDSRQHWERIYSTKDSGDLSWHQDRLRLSLEIIAHSGIAPDASLIDVGGGDSTLVADLLGMGFRNLTVLDISASALERARRRLGEAARQVRWIEADITAASLPPAAFDFWHDRAVFHFLTDPEDRRRYTQQAIAALRPGAFLLIACFAPDGPERCSGLPVVRAGEADLLWELGASFTLVESQRESHRTPGGTAQEFLYSLFRFTPGPAQPFQTG